MAEMLEGGVGNAGAVFRDGEVVERPAAANARTLHTLLRGLHDVGFTGVPLPLDEDVSPGGRERLGWIEGDVPIPPFPRWSQTTDVLTSVARLLRRYHDAVARVPIPADAEWHRPGMADPEGGPIICHNDVCCENVVFVDGEAVALLDFDFAAPGRPAWDVATTARMWVPTIDQASAALYDRAGLDPIARLTAFCDAYGLTPEDRELLPDLLIQSMEVGGAMVDARMGAGEPAFLEMWERSGGEQASAARVAWLRANLAALAEAIRPPR